MCGFVGSSYCGPGPLSRLTFAKLRELDLNRNLFQNSVEPYKKQMNPSSGWNYCTKNVESPRRKLSPLSMKSMN